MGVTPEGRRTQALRGPGAGGFTPPTSQAATNPCLNCGTNVQLEYCPECGQRSIDSDPTLRDLLHELAEDFLHWDGKLVRTYRALLSRPGALTLEYLAGRRVRYISPLRVYLSCSVLFFMLSAIAPRAPTAEAAIPKAIFVLAPLYAALIRIVYRDRRRRYPQHLAFALHVHAVLFLALSAMLAARFLPTPMLRAGYRVLVLIPFVLYLARAARIVYEGSMGQTIARLAISGIAYVAALFVIVTAVVALAN